MHPEHLGGAPLVFREINQCCSMENLVWSINFGWNVLAVDLKFFRCSGISDGRFSNNSLKMTSSNSICASKGSVLSNPKMLTRHQII